MNNDDMLVPCDMTVKEVLFPCEMAIKVIAKKHEGFSDFLQQTAAEFFAKDSFMITDSNESRTGAYHSLTLAVTATSREGMHSFYKALKQNPKVVFAL